MNKICYKKLKFFVFGFSIFFITFLFITIFPQITSAAPSLTLTNAEYNSDTQINLRWTTTPNAVEYEIFRVGLVGPINTIYYMDIEKDFHEYIDTGLEPNTLYTYRIEARDQNGNVLYTYGPESITTDNIKKPKIISAYLDINTNKAVITWENDTLATNDIYVYEVNTGTQIAGPINSVDSYISFSDPILNSGTANSYYLIAEARNGNRSSRTNYVNIIPISIPEIQASLKSGITTISWNRVPNIEEYVLERAEYVDGEWTDWIIINDNLKKNTTSIKDQTGSENQFRYRLRIDTDKYKGVSNISNPIKTIFPPTDIKVLYLGLGKIEISWTNPENPDFKIRIERRTDKERYIIIATLDRNITSYIDTDNIRANTNYYYKITCFDIYGNTAYEEISISSSIPSSPSNLSAYIYQGNVELIWKDNSNNESGFIVERKINSGDYVEIADLTEDSNSYRERSRSITDTYRYRVIAYNASGKSRSYTNEVIILPGNHINRNDYPVITSIIEYVPGQVKLTWNSSAYETLIERKEFSDTDWEVLDVLKPYVSEFIDEEIVSNTRYIYRISFIIGDNIYLGYDPNGRSITTGLSLPKNIKISIYSKNYIKISWSSLKNSSDTVIIERKTIFGTFVQVDEVKYPTNVWYDYDSNSINNTYRIKIVNGSNVSGYSEELQADETSSDENLQNISYEQLSNSEILLKWKDDFNKESGFYIEMKKGSNWEIIKVLESNSTSYKIEGLVLNTQYIFRVSAFGADYDVLQSSDEIKITLKNLSSISSETAANITKIDNVNIKVLTSNHLLIKWPKETNNKIDFYLILQENASNEFKEIGKVKNDERFLVKNLKPNNQYRFKVVGYVGNIEFSSSNIISATTLRHVTFDDIFSVPWAQESIEALASCDIVKGKSRTASLFAPNDKITRAEFVNLLVRSMDIVGVPSGSFIDVQPQHWYYESVMIAKSIGLVTGSGNNYFNPNEAITREEIVILTAKALKLRGIISNDYDTSVLNNFSDRQFISTNALEPFAILYQEGIINGISSTKLSPNNLTTRAEVAVIINKFLEKIWMTI